MTSPVSPIGPNAFVFEVVATSLAPTICAFLTGLGPPPRWQRPAGTHGYACADKKVPWIKSSNTDCTDARRGKCGASQAFLLIGFATHAVATVAPFVPKIPPLVGVGCAGTASFCYFVVWCIWAYLIDNKATDKASCGLHEDRSTISGGYAFGSTIIAWMACTAQAFIMVTLGTRPPAVRGKNDEESESDGYADGTSADLDTSLLPAQSTAGSTRQDVDTAGVAFDGPSQAEPDRKFSLHWVALSVSVVMWTSILMMVACTAGEPYTANPSYDDATDDDASTTCGGPATAVSIVGIVFFSISAVLYLVSAWFSGTRKFIFSQEDHPHVVALVTRCKEAAPSIGHSVVCSHTETYTVPVSTTVNGITTTRTETRTRTVVTYTGSSAFFYKSWADVSDGLPAWIIEEELVKLKSHRGYSFADQETKAQFDAQGVELYNANRHRDTNCSVSVLFDFDGYKSHVLCVDKDLNDQDPLILEKWLWWVMVLGGLGWVHRMLLERWSTRLTFQFRKVISLSDIVIDRAAELIPGDPVEEEPELEVGELETGDSSGTTVPLADSYI
jgi:hypothetical protein